MSEAEVHRVPPSDGGRPGRGARASCVRAPAERRYGCLIFDLFGPPVPGAASQLGPMSTPLMK